MATIDVTTLGVLTQADVAGTLVSGGALINWGRSPGETLSTRQRFQHASGYPLTNPQSVVAALPAGTVATLVARNASGGVIDTWEFTVLGSRVLDGGPGFPGASRYRAEIDMDLDIGTAGSWSNPPGAAVNNYVIRSATTTSGDVSSHRNFNFNNTVTLDLIRGANQLGTDSNGRIIPTADRDVQITMDTAFPMDPERGDFHFLTADIAATGGPDPGIDNVLNASGNVVLYTNYGHGSIGIDVPSLGIINIQITGQRNTLTPRLGVAGQPVELFYRTGSSGTWQPFGTTTDSAPNGNQFRVRIDRDSAIANFPGVSISDQIGYRARPATTGSEGFDAGTYIYDGSTWQQLSANAAPTTASDNHVSDVRIISQLATSDWELQLDRVGLSQLQVDLPDIVPGYLRSTLGDVPNNIAPPIDAIGSIGQVLAVEAFGSGFTRLNWTDPASSITVEGHDGTDENNVINDVTHIDFSHSDFFVDPGISGRVLVRSRSGGGGGTSILVQDHSRNEVDTLTTLNIGGGLIVTPDDPADPASAVEAVVEALRVNLVTAGGTPIINHLNVFSVEAPSGTPYIFPSASGMFSGETVQFINDGDFLILKNVTSSTLTIEHSGVLGTHRIDGLLQDLEIQQNETVTLVYSTTGSTTTDANDTWLITHRTSDISDLSITNTAGSMTAANLENITIGDGLVLNVADANNATISAAPGLATVEIAMAAVTDFTLNAVNIITAEANNLRIPATADDGDILIVKNRSGSARSFGTTAEVDGITRGRIADFVSVEDGDSITLVYSTDLATDGWVITSTYTQPTHSQLYTHTANRPINSTDTGSSTWNVRHNLNNRNPIVQIYEETANSVGNILTSTAVLPDTIDIVDENRLTITFSTNVAGTATVLG